MSALILLLVVLNGVPAWYHRRLPRCIAIGIVAVVVALGSLALVEWRASRHVMSAGFWFDAVTFELGSPQVERVGGALDELARRTIEETAWREVQTAFTGLRLALSANRDAFYRVRVVQQLENPAAAGQSRVLRPLGGQGAVNFTTIANHAVSYAPPGADRATLLAAIGRGLGRAAVHEFAHQILVGVDIHTAKDPLSYEFPTADRAAQYYGPMRWDLAWPLLVERLGRRPPGA